MPLHFVWSYIAGVTAFGMAVINVCGNDTMWAHTHTHKHTQTPSPSVCVWLSVCMLSFYMIPALHYWLMYMFAGFLEVWMSACFYSWNTSPTAARAEGEYWKSHDIHVHCKHCDRRPCAAILYMCTCTWQRCPAIHVYVHIKTCLCVCVCVCVCLSVIVCLHGVVLHIPALHFWLLYMFAGFLKIRISACFY